jgi:hypothetical protein
VEYITQEALIREFFMQYPNQDIPHKMAVDFLYSEYEKRTGKRFADPDRGIRKLAQSGFLIKVAKGIYRYDPEYITNPTLEDFSEADKKHILVRDGYKCVICGRGQEHGVELHVDHIKPKDLGGQATISNGQTLCGQHNYLKKNLKQTETGKKMFIRLYELAKENGDAELLKFCHDILETFEKHGINGHIEWKK